MAKKTAIALLLGLVFAIGASATTVSFSVIEAGTPNGANSPSSRQWENVLLNTFFDAGFIVTNFPIQSLNEIPNDRNMEDFLFNEIDIARDVGADYLLVALLDYTTGDPSPSEIQLTLFRISPYAKLHERRFAGRNHNNEREQIEHISGIVSGLIPHIRSGRLR